jgi:hypothetical protein
MRLYLDTSIIGALFDTEMPQRVKITRLLLDSIIKDLKENLLSVIRNIPFQIISEDESSAELLEIYEKEGFVRKAARLDLRHLAVATVNGVDAVISWNFRDIVNIRTRRAVHSINLRLGLPLIEIVSPEEVVLYEEKD